MITITHKESGAALFHGRQTGNWKTTLEAAIKENIDLSGANLRGRNLAGGQYDGVRLRGADLSGANLLDSNLSECDLRDADLSGACLSAACLCESDLSGADLAFARLGDADIHHALFRETSFEGASWMSLPFGEAAEIRECTAVINDGLRLRFSGPPKVIRGFEKPILILDQAIVIGEKVLALNALSHRERTAIFRNAQN